MKKISSHPARGRPAKNLLVILGISLLTLGVFVGIAEVYFRVSAPFTATHWPGHFDPRLGNTFEPGAILQWTNGVDFWTRTRVNSLGFLDREPPAGPADSGCRVLFIGDSNVEALQVPIEQKSHVVFERLAREQLPALGIETLAFGHGGTGQANQLAYYEFFGAPLQPDVVVLVAAGNDFADNSPILDSARHGWHPLHLRRLYFAISPDGDRIIRQPIDPDWKQYRLADPGATLRPFHTILLQHSYFYRWLFTNLEAELPALATWLSGQPASPDFVTARLRDIENIDGFGQAFAEWNYPDDLDMNEMFNAEDPLPPVFAQALRLTGHALDEFLQRARSDRFRLLLFAVHSLSRDYAPGTVIMGRTLRERGYLRRLETLAAARGIPLIDQNRYILAAGGTPREARFSRDGHWSERGHQWAAEALLEYFRQYPQICSEHPHKQPAG